MYETKITIGYVNTHLANILQSIIEYVIEMPAVKLCRLLLTRHVVQTQANFVWFA